MNRRLLLLLTWCLAVLAIYPRALSQTQLCRVKISLIDNVTKQPVPGVIRVLFKGHQEGMPIKGLLERGQGVGSIALQQLGALPPRRTIHDWYVLTGPTEVLLPRKPIRIEAFSGLETELVRLSTDLTMRSHTSIELPLKTFSQVTNKNWFAGNTHLHLFKLSRKNADRYLREIPRGDRLDILFTSHLIRPSEDAHYISNRYSIGDLRQFWSSGVLVNHGEEHRHNLAPWAEGYGHVMLLNIKKVIEPVSIGPGITGAGNDGTPLQQGINEAHRQGGTAIWCHNDLGLERVPTIVNGNVDAQNIFDGYSVEQYPQYESTFYHYLNAGFRVPFSTGTDWFLFDLSRVYAQVEGTLEIATWLEALRKGRSFITNGPLLHFFVENQPIGGTVSLTAASPISVEGQALGRRNFGNLELVHNGNVIDKVSSQQEQQHFRARIQKKILIKEPGWMALRVSSQTNTEYGLPIFAHTSAIYIEVEKKSIRQSNAVAYLKREIEAARHQVSTKAIFGTVSERKMILDIYDSSLLALANKGESSTQ